MFNLNDKISQQTANQLGVWISPGLGLGYPALKDILRKLHTERVALLKFVPRGWATAVDELQKQFPDDLVRLSPAMMQNGAFILSNPEWMRSSVEVADAWQVVFFAENKAIGNYAQQQQAQGKAELDALYKKAEFWDRAYKIADGVANAPANAFNAVYDRLSGNVKMLLIGGVVIGVLVLTAPYIMPLIRAKK